MVDISLDRKVGGVLSYFHCVIFLLLNRLALIHYTRFRSTIPWHGRPWVEHGVTTECSTIRVIVRALIYIYIYIYIYTMLSQLSLLGAQYLSSVATAMINIVGHTMGFQDSSHPCWIPQIQRFSYEHKRWHRIYWGRGTDVLLTWIATHNKA